MAPSEEEPVYSRPFHILPEELLIMSAAPVARYVKIIPAWCICLVLRYWMKVYIRANVSN